MKRVLAFVSIILLFQNFSIEAFQESTEIARIDDTSILADEFLYAFKKNRDPKAPVNKDSLLNYLERYINFKLKVIAARKLGTDTLKTFRDEYESYASQIAKPYLDNHNKEESLIEEAYQRAQKEVRAAHILIRYPASATPQDTLKAWQKIDSLRALALSGTSFDLLAKQNSADGSAQKGGDLGWFTAFSMIYPFESAAYNTDRGSISPIIKTQFGYHILKVTGKRPANGRIKTSHIFIARSKHQQAQGEKLIKAVYDSLQNGGSWNALCKAFSEDERSKAQNGALPMAGIGQLPAEYLEHAFKVKYLNTYNAPVETPYGWHIIRLDKRETIAPLNEVRAQFADRIKRSGRLQYGKNEVLKKLKQNNGFKPTPNAVDEILAALKNMRESNDSLLYDHKSALFQLEGKVVYTKDFLTFLDKTAKLGPNGNYLSAYKRFEEETIFAYEDSVALIKYPEYRLLLQEYEEGLLLFEIMEDEIWNKALEDSIGLQVFYEKNKKRYPAPERAETFIISARSSTGAQHLSTAKSILESEQGFLNADSLLKAKMPTTDYSLLKIAKRTLTQDDLPIFANGKLTKNQPVFSENQSEIYLISNVLPEGLYALEEIKGRVTADYQDFLDEKWIKRLRKENKVKVYKKRIASLLPFE